MLDTLNTSRGHNSVILVAERNEILPDMVKMLESKAIKTVDNPESEPEIDDNPEPKPEVDDKLEGHKLLLSWCHSKKRFPHSLCKLKSSLLRLL